MIRLIPIPFGILVNSCIMSTTDTVEPRIINDFVFHTLYYLQIKQDNTDYVTDQKEKSFKFIVSTKGLLKTDHGK